jgi:hypothetical protein
MSDRVPALAHGDDEVAYVAIGAAGLASFTLGLIADLRVLRALGLVGALAGGALLARSKLAARSEKIHAATNVIRTELDDLDPVARAQVLADIAQSEL